MRNEDRSAVSPPGRFSKECIARFTRRSFDGHLRSLAKQADVCGTEFEFNAAVRCTASASLADSLARQAERLPYNFTVVTFDQSLHKPRIGIARSSAQSMIQV